jgi:cytochrome c oxidase subunit 1
MPVALNSLGLWVTLMLALTVINYGFPIVQLMARSDTSVPAIRIDDTR